ncbi:MAG: type II secretion system protein GspM [Casimicrobiaceae bacterium]
MTVATLMRPLDPKQSRALAVALLFVAVFLALAVLLAPFLLMHRHYNQAIDSAQDRLERYRRIAAQGPELQKALEALREKQGRRFYLKNTASNLAGAEMQDLVRAAVENNGGRITTIQIVATRDDGSFRQIGVNLQLFATTANLQKILYAIETQQPYMLVENLTVRPLNAFRGFKPAPGAEPEVSVLLDVSGFAYPGAEKK